MTDQEMADMLLAEMQRQFPDASWKVAPPSAYTKNDERFLRGAFVVDLKRDSAKVSQIVSYHALSTAYLEPFVHVLGGRMIWMLDNP